jgi:energy-coupling factor transporter ATP-binding protein EcfA2
VTETRRILVVGPPGSGKSTLARRLGGALEVPVHELDLVYREGGGNGPLRPPEQRQADVARILGADAWIAEGAHLGWTAGLLAAADVIVWLDHTSPTKRRGRVMRRFVGGAASSARREHGARRFMRVGDYARHLREMVGALRDARNDEAAEIEAALAPYAERVVRCRTQADVEGLIGRLIPPPATTVR